MKYVRQRCLLGLRLKLDYSIKCTSSLLGPLWLHSKLREPAGIRIFTTLRRSLLLALKLFFDSIRDLKLLVSASIFVIDIFTWLLQELISNAHPRFNIWTKKLRKLEDICNHARVCTHVGSRISGDGSLHKKNLDCIVRRSKWYWLERIFSEDGVWKIITLSV